MKAFSLMSWCEVTVTIFANKLCIFVCESLLSVMAAVHLNLSMCGHVFIIQQASLTVTPVLRHAF